MHLILASSASSNHQKSGRKNFNSGNSITPCIPLNPNIYKNFKRISGTTNYKFGKWQVKYKYIRANLRTWYGIQKLLGVRPWGYVIGVLFLTQNGFRIEARNDEIHGISR